MIDSGRERNNALNGKSSRLSNTLLKAFSKLMKPTINYLCCLVYLCKSLFANCFGSRMSCCSINLFNIDCKIDMNSFPRQLVKVIHPLL